MKQLYANFISNAGLILLATLSLGIWTSNIQDFLTDKNASHAKAAPQDFDEFMKQRAERQELAGLGQRVKAGYPGAYDDLTDEDLGGAVKRKYGGATAICNDDTASYSSTRAGTCSYHGGVRIWLTSP